MLSKRKKNGLVLTVMSFWFMCLVFSEVELITRGNEGCQVTAKILKAAL